MKKIRRSPVVTGFLFLLAVVLLFAGGVGGTQAALQVFSDNYYSAMDMKYIGVSLLENGVDTSTRVYGTTAASGFTDKMDGNLVLKKLENDPSFQIGKKYPFVITAVNSGEIDTYLRITVYKYWANVGKEEPIFEKGWFHGLSDVTTKFIDKEHDPATIRLGYGGKEGYNTSAWILDEASSTDERDIYYYIGILPTGGETDPLFDKLWIDPSVAKTAKVTTNGNVTTYTYAYDGLGFVVQAETDAIQTHHARDAIRSAWGVRDDDLMDRMKIPTE